MYSLPRRPVPVSPRRQDKDHRYPYRLAFLRRRNPRMRRPDQISPRIEHRGFCQRRATCLSCGILPTASCACVAPTALMKSSSLSPKRLGFLPRLRRPAHGRNRRPPGRSRHPAGTMRQWVLSFPIPLRVVFVSQPYLLSPVLQGRPPGHLRIFDQTGETQTHPSRHRRRHPHPALWLDPPALPRARGLYRTTDGVPVFHGVHAPTTGELQALLARIIKRLMKFLTPKGYLIEEQGMIPNRYHHPSRSAFEPTIPLALARPRHQNTPNLGASG